MIIASRRCQCYEANCLYTLTGRKYISPINPVRAVDVSNGARRSRVPQEGTVHRGLRRLAFIEVIQATRLERLTRRNCPGVTPVTVRKAIEKLDAALKPRRAAISFNGSSVSVRYD